MHLSAWDHPNPPHYFELDGSLNPKIGFWRENVCRAVPPHSSDFIPSAHSYSIFVSLTMPVPIVCENMTLERIRGIYPNMKHKQMVRLELIIQMMKVAMFSKKDETLDANCIKALSRGSDLKEFMREFPCCSNFEIKVHVAIDIARRFKAIEEGVGALYTEQRWEKRVELLVDIFGEYKTINVFDVVPTRMANNWRRRAMCCRTSRHFR
ncbi:unnamed protein product [Caenorhabditis bovis]|uniref:Uncharacterized protein n=1 Tax=Caenorhabditis bovis TaxID=2654633 RepID=A0A8S1EL83_9PELO|nr:unnamed protein product [Caenorhabditis bovis]